MKDINWEFEDDETDDFIHPDFIDHKDFYNFLIDNNALNNYIKNFKICFDNGSIFDGLKSFLDKRNKSKFIKIAFIWEETAEGHIFWEMIDKKWTDSFFS